MSTSSDRRPIKISKVLSAFIFDTSIHQKQKQKNGNWLAKRATESIRREKLVEWKRKLWKISDENVNENLTLREDTLDFYEAWTKIEVLRLIEVECVHFFKPKCFSIILTVISNDVNEIQKILMGTYLLYTVRKPSGK